MRKLFVLLFCVGATALNLKAQDSWVMESIAQSMEKDSVTEKRYFKVVFRVVPEGMYQTENQLKHSRVWSQNFDPQLFLAQIRKAKAKTGEEVLRFKEHVSNNPDKVEEFKSSPLETEVYGEKGFVPPPENG